VRPQQSVQQASLVWRSAFLTTNLKRNIFVSRFLSKQKIGYDAYPIASNFFALKKNAYFKTSVG
jgi:exosortase/archaeosortase